jgi:putative serine protease PepD
MTNFEPPHDEQPMYPGYQPYVPPQPPAPPEFPGLGESVRPRKPRFRSAVAATALLAAAIGGGVGAGVVALTDDNGQHVANAGLTFSTQAAPAAKTDGSVQTAAAKIGPSVVTINVSTQDEQDTGSGVIIRNDGYILTNNHVIAAAVSSNSGSTGGFPGSPSTSGGSTINVVLADGRHAAATIVGTDESDDLAVIKVNLTGLTAASFASSKSLAVGQSVVAVGAPLGLSDTVTAGIVSTLARPVTTGDGQSTQAIFNAVQTDAAINPGNSGGPLVNLSGDVVGINAAIATDQSSGGLQIPGQSSQSGNIGIGFAIPSDEASRIAGELINNGKATHALLGVTVGDQSNAADTGAVIGKVTAGGPAAQAGLQTGDVVTKIDDLRVDTSDALVAAVRSYAPETEVTLTYERHGKSATTKVRLGTQNS